MMKNLIPSPEACFIDSGPMYHIYTEPPEGEVLFVSEEQLSEALLLLCMAAYESASTILAYAIMSNHIHVMIRQGNPEEFFQIYRDAICKRSLGKKEHATFSIWRAGYTKIDSLKGFRSELAYIVRNPYVVRRDVNPLSFYWCSGFLYFNSMVGALPSFPAEKLTYDKKRQLFRARTPRIPKGLTLISDKLVNPASFVDITTVETLFEDARKYVTSIFRNVEAQVETAISSKAQVLIPDEELLPLIYDYCDKTFNGTRVAVLSQTQKKALASHLKYRFHSSNKQISRLVGMREAEVFSLFPLSSETESKELSPAAIRL